MDYQVLGNLFVRPALEWFRELKVDNLPFYSNDNNCFVKVFVKKFLTETQKTELQEAFYARVQAPGELGEDYITAKIALWRRTAPVNQELGTEQVMSVKRGLLPHNEFYLELKAPKTLEELRAAVRMADHFNQQPNGLPTQLVGIKDNGIVNKDHQLPRNNLVNVAIKTPSQLEKRVDDLANQLEKMVTLQQKLIESQTQVMQNRDMGKPQSSIICYNYNMLSLIAQKTSTTGRETWADWNQSHEVKRASALQQEKDPVHTVQTIWTINQSGDPAEVTPEGEAMDEDQEKSQLPPLKFDLLKAIQLGTQEAEANKRERVEAKKQELQQADAVAVADGRTKPSILAQANKGFPMMLKPDGSVDEFDLWEAV
ncbi:hypothetical protein BJV82DRAFT_674614 [Fennellomyces sp. T-0311]|nr:hypothetical protein BJV82DRAFT_674614 [Fennellomyces sp. T-0311]